MNLNQPLLSEFDHEMAQTRRALERIPTDKFDFKPHPRSGTMGWLAGHIAMMPMWAVMTIQNDHLSLDGMAPPSQPASAEELISLFDKNVVAARKAIGGASNENLTAIWSMTMGGRKVMEMPRIAVLRGMI